MAILYRAIWTDSRPDLVDSIRTAALSWIEGKSDGQFADLSADGVSPDGAMRLRVEHEYTQQADAAITAALRVTFVEDSGGDGARWTTSVRSWEGPGTASDAGSHGGWVWVDLDAVTHDSLDGITVAAPRLVRDLLAGGATSWRQRVPLASTPLPFKGEGGAEELAALVTDIDRDIPIVVFAPLPASFHFDGLPPSVTISEQFAASVERAAGMTAGLTVVCMLDESGMASFNDILGFDYGVWDGAFRIYLPGADPALNEAWKHRYTVPVRFLRFRDTAGKIISRSVSARAGARRAPASYEQAAQLLESVRGRTVDELTELVDMAYDELGQERDKVVVLDQRYLDAIEELQQLEEENNRLRSDLSVARKKLAFVEPSLWQQHPESMAHVEGQRLPANADSPSEAALLAQEYLQDYLVFPDDACVDLADLDSAVEARAWGQTSWRAFVALHAYGEALVGETDPGSFWTWCANSGHPDAWPATSKKLSMVESETVNNNDRLRRKRTFPVARDVAASEKIYMEAHIKIAEGGGVLAPRIYFLSSRDTGQVHIGYFGPHRNVPNSLA